MGGRNLLIFYFFFYILCHQKFITCYPSSPLNRDVLLFVLTEEFNGIEWRTSLKGPTLLPPLGYVCVHQRDSTSLSQPSGSLGSVDVKRSASWRLLPERRAPVARSLPSLKWSRVGVVQIPIYKWSHTHTPSMELWSLYGWDSLVFLVTDLECVPPLVKYKGGQSHLLKYLIPVVHLMSSRTESSPCSSCDPFFRTRPGKIVSNCP